MFFVYSCIFSLSLILKLFVITLCNSGPDRNPSKRGFGCCYLLDKLIRFFEVRVAAFRLAQRFVFTIFFVVEDHFKVVNDLDLL